MGWIQCGNELPQMDKHGDRPIADDNGKVRDTEIVPYEKFEALEFDVDEMRSGKDRRFATVTLQNMARIRSSSTGLAMDYEVSFKVLTGQYVKGIRLKETSEELSPEAMTDFLENWCDFKDILPILTMIRIATELAESKKKNCKQLFV